MIETGANSFDFYEVPKPRHGNNQTPVSAVGLDNGECTSVGTGEDLPVQPITGENIEIYNRDLGTDRGINTQKETGGEPDIYIPKVKEIVISRPVATGKERPAYTPPKKEGFVF